MKEKRRRVLSWEQIQARKRLQDYDDAVRRGDKNAVRFLGQKPHPPKEGSANG